MIGYFLALLLQAQSPAPSASQAQPAPAFHLEFAEDKMSLAVADEGARLSDIVADLKKQLKVPVTLSRSLVASKVKLGFSDRPLEEALGRLAPQVYVDYRATSGPSGKATLIAITLRDATEDAPPLPAERQTTIVLEGIPNDPEVENLKPQREESDAQTLLEPPSDKPFVQILYRAGLVSVRVHDRSPAAIGNDLADRLGVSFTAHSGLEQGPIDLEITSVPVDDLARWLPPGMSVLYRRETNTRTVTPLRILLGEPQAPTTR